MKHSIIVSSYAAIAIDKVEQASLESFPASDAPSWIWGESQASMTEKQGIAECDPAQWRPVASKSSESDRIPKQVNW